jgi:hypothetical protein
MTETARRLAVIIMEDAFLHPDYPLLAWLMLAGEEFEVCQEYVESVL